MPVHIDLTGKVALVTGASGGIGLASARRLAEAGARVVVTDRSQENARAGAQVLLDAGLSAYGRELDVTDRAGITAALEETTAVFGPVDILVNNAGAWTIQNFLDRPLDIEEDDIAVNLVGVIDMCRHVVPGMAERGHGVVVNVSSEGGRMGQVRMSTYSGAKAGVVGFSKALAREVGGKGIRVNCVSPSITKTETNADLRARWNEANVLKDFPLGRLGEPVDQANAVLFLASDLSSWITGQVISVNGGYVM